LNTRKYHYTVKWKGIIGTDEQHQGMVSRQQGRVKKERRRELETEMVKRSNGDRIAGKYIASPPRRG
jgi:hypothetical protein